MMPTRTGQRENHKYPDTGKPVRPAAYGASRQATGNRTVTGPCAREKKIPGEPGDYFFWYFLPAEKALSMGLPTSQ